MRAEEFGNVFFEEQDIGRVMQHYGKFREDAIRFKGHYLQLETFFNENCGTGTVSASSWKAAFLKFYRDIVELCSKVEGNGGGNRKELIERILDLLWESLDVFTGFPEERDDLRFSVLDVMLDAICAYSEENYKFQYSAIIYDIVYRLNGEDEEFYQFYGKKAERRIVERMLEIIEITYGKTASSLNKKIDRICLTFRDKPYVENFCRLLLTEQRLSKKREADRGWKKKEIRAPGSQKLWVCMLLAVLAGYLLGFFSYPLFFGKESNAGKGTASAQVSAEAHENFGKETLEKNTERTTGKEGTKQDGQNGDSDTGQSGNGNHSTSCSKTGVTGAKLWEPRRTLLISQNFFSILYEIPCRDAFAGET